MKTAALPFLWLMTAPMLAADPYQPHLYTVPALPNTIQPTELHFETWCLSRDTTGPVLRREGRVLQVGVFSDGCITSYPPPKDRPFSISAGLLEPGSYTVELWILDDTTSIYLERKASFVIEVGEPPAPFSDPQIPLDTLPVRVVLTSPNFFGLHFEAMTRRNGSTIQVEASGPPCPFTCAPTYIPADLGRLEAGTYRLEWVESGQVLGVYSLVVAEGPRLDFVPAVPIENDVIQLTITTPGQCPTAAPPTLVGNRLQIVLENAACLPPQTDGGLGMILPPLAAGAYEVEVLANGQPAARETLDVLPAEATLGQGRFRVTASWRSRLGEFGIARLAEPTTTDSALYYFFSPNNWELMVKVLNGCAINGHYWVFAAASTDVEYTVSIIDNLAGAGPFTFGNTAGQPAVAVTNINAFPCLGGLQ